VLACYRAPAAALAGGQAVSASMFLVLSIYGSPR
jgi:hypothetical protein